MSRGAVAAGHRLSARAGAEVLAEGGNAFDATLAAAFAGAVCEGALTGPAAGGFLLARPSGDAPTVLDFMVAAPGLGPHGTPLDPAELDVFTISFGGALQEFHNGPASVATPGMVAGLIETHRRWCTLPLSALVAPAATLAREGVVITPEVAYFSGILAQMLVATPECAAIYAPRGSVLAEGEILRNPDLADTLELIAAGGADELSNALEAHQRATGGHVTGDDLAEYRVIERTPLVVDYRGMRMYTNPPPSSGGALVAAALEYLSQEESAEGDVGHYRCATAAGVHANTVRDEWERETRKPAGSTTHISAIDADGNVASMSSSNGSGCGVVVPGTGVMLNNIMGEEDLNPGGFGRVPAGQRMTSMMAPSILLSDTRAIALGSAGSNRLRSAILQTVMGVVDGQLQLADAVSRPRVHPERGGVDVEGGVPQEAVDALTADGYELRRWGAMNLFFGGVSAVAREAGVFSGGGDPRRGGYAAIATERGNVVDAVPDPAGG